MLWFIQESKQFNPNSMRNICSLPQITYVLQFENMFSDSKFRHLSCKKEDLQDGGEIKDIFIIHRLLFCHNCSNKENRIRKNHTELSSWKDRRLHQHTALIFQIEKIMDISLTQGLKTLLGSNWGCLMSLGLISFMNLETNGSVFCTSFFLVSTKITQLFDT